MRGERATLYIVFFVTLLARKVMESEMVNDAIVDFASPLYWGFRVRPRDWKMMAREIFWTMACQRLNTVVYLS